MRITLAYPQPTPLYTSKGSCGVPMGLGLLYLATLVKDHHDVEIIGSATNPMSTEELVDRISANPPDVLGISTVFSTLMLSGREIARQIKERFPATRILFGGNHSHFIAEELGREDYADIVVIGEGEYTFRDLIQALDRGTPLHEVNGILFKDDGKVVRTPPREPIADLDALPFPDWDLVKEKLPEDFRVPMCGSRGCPYHCIYCSTTAFWTRKWRCRSAGNVFAEMVQMADRYFSGSEKTIFYGFVDDNFTVNRARVFELCRLIRESGRDFAWGGSSRLELIDDEMIEALASAGCREVFFGVESGSEPVLRQMKRYYSRDEVKTKIAKCIDCGIIPTLSFIIGLPYETRETVNETISLMNEVASYKVQYHIFTPFIGTDVWNDPESFGVQLTTELSDEMNLEQKAFLSTRYLSPEDIEKLFHRGMGYVARRYREQRLIEKRAAAGAARYHPARLP